MTIAFKFLALAICVAMFLSVVLLIQMSIMTSLDIREKRIIERVGELEKQLAELTSKPKPRNFKTEGAEENL